MILESRIGLAWKSMQVAAILLLMNGSAFAQGFDALATEHHRATPDATSIEVQYGHLFESEQDNGGNMTRNGAALNLRHRLKLTDTTGLTLFGGYQLSAYDFAGSPFSPGSGGFQWDDVHEMRIVGLFDYKIDEKWSIVAAGAFFSHIEAGADFDKGLTGGGGLGFNYRASENLTLGVLIGAMSGIEDSVTLLPIPRVDWRFAEGWRWRIDMFSAFGGRGIGTELSVQASDLVELAVGIQRQRRRFRLTDHTTRNQVGIPRYTSNGVGEETSIPVFARMSFSPTSNLNIDVRAGVAVQGQLRSETRTGALVEADQFDWTPIVGIGGHFTF